MRSHLKYLRYVARHKWYVFLECCKLGIPWLGITHDWSKFRPSEWPPYVNWFHKERLQLAKVIVDEPAPYRFSQCIHYDGRTHVIVAMNAHYLGLLPWKCKSALDTAWLHHQRRNKHHWQYWLLINDEDGTCPLPIPDKYRREMLADWRGMGHMPDMYNAKDWYLKIEDKIKLHPDTRAWIENQLDCNL